jgi:hypothetical protein
MRLRRQPKTNEEIIPQKMTKKNPQQQPNIESVSPSSENSCYYYEMPTSALLPLIGNISRCKIFSLLSNEKNEN